jgi:hypothetical protein
LTAEDTLDRSQVRKGSLRKKDEDGLVRSIKDINIVDSGRYKHKGESRVDTTKTVSSLADSTVKDAREEKSEIIKEMKSWIKTIDYNIKNASFQHEIILPKLQNALYKWCLFIE